MSGGGGGIFTKGVFNVPGVNSGGLIGGWNNSPKIPQLEQPIIQPKIIPTLDSKSVQDAKLKELRALQLRSGRQSTILTDKFGG